MGGFFLNRDPEQRRREAFYRQRLDAAKEFVLDRPVDDGRRNPFARAAYGLLDVATRGLAREVLPEDSFRDYLPQERIAAEGGGPTFDAEGARLPALEGYDAAPVQAGGFRGTDAATAGTQFERYMRLPEQMRALTLMEHPEDLASLSPGEFDTLFPASQTLQGPRGEVIRKDPSGQLITERPGEMEKTGDPLTDTLMQLDAIIQSGGDVVAADMGRQQGFLPGSPRYRQASQAAVELAQKSKVRLENAHVYQAINDAKQTPETYQAVLGEHGEWLAANDPETFKQLTQAIGVLRQTRDADLERTKSLTKAATHGGTVTSQELLQKFDRPSDIDAWLRDPREQARAQKEFGENYDGLVDALLEQRARMVAVEEKRGKTDKTFEEWVATAQDLPTIALVRDRFAAELEDPANANIAKKLEQQEQLTLLNLRYGGDRTALRERSKKRAEDINKLVLAADAFSMLEGVAPRALAGPGAAAEFAKNFALNLGESEERASAVYEFMTGGTATLEQVTAARATVRDLAFDLRNHIILDEGKRISDKEMELIKEAEGQALIANPKQIAARFRTLIKIGLRERVIVDLIEDGESDFSGGWTAPDAGAEAEASAAKKAEKTIERLQAMGFSDEDVAELMFTIRRAERIAGLFGVTRLDDAQAGVDWPEMVE